MPIRPQMCLALALLLPLGCSPDSQPTEPEAPAPPGDLAARAFQLTIDVASGRVLVASPASQSRASHAVAGGPSFSLLGNEVVALHAGNCTFSSIPNNTKRKRCTLQLSIENRLELSDLVTPTTFPSPPAGVEGLLVFPYISAGLGSPGSAAVPNGQWDEAPRNFFNDFTGCSSKSSDCYRWERYPAPLSAGETSDPRAVGFDIDIAAQAVTVFILVAADVRDAAPHSLTLTPVAAGCGSLGISGASDQWYEGDLLVGYGISDEGYGLCTFELPAFLKDKNIVSATLTLHQVSMTGEFAEGKGRVIAQLVSYTVPPVNGGFNSVTVLEDDLGTVSDSPEAGPRSLDVLIPILTELAAERPRIQYRLMGTPVGTQGITTFAGLTGGATDPSLTVQYRDR